MAKQHGRGTDSALRIRLQELRNRISSLTNKVDGVSLESTQLQVLNTLTNLLAENKLDFEIKSVKDANGDVFQLRGSLNEETGVYTWDYIDAEGNVATPVTPVEFLNPDALLTAIQTTLETIDTVLDNIKIDTANLDVALSTRAADATVVATNNLLTIIDAVLDNIKLDTANLDVALSTRATETTLQVLTNQKTPTSIDTDVAGTAGSVPIGATEISFFNAGNNDATVNGITIPAGVTRTFGFHNPISTAITFDALTSRLLIDYMA